MLSHFVMLKNSVNFPPQIFKKLVNFTLEKTKNSQFFGWKNEKKFQKKIIAPNNPHNNKSVEEIYIVAI